jgi:hypothetical protein
VKVAKKRKTGAFDAIQALRKKPNVDAQVILKTVSGLPKGMLMLITLIGGWWGAGGLTSLDDRKAGSKKGTMDDKKIT